MDIEGVSSLAVVDNSMNVVGNISMVDVKASLCPLSIRLSSLLTRPPAPHQSLLRASATKHMHPLHQRDTILARHNRRPRLISSLPHLTTLDARARRRQTGRHQIAPVMGHESRLSRPLGPSYAQSLPCSFKPARSTSRHAPVANKRQFTTARQQPCAFRCGCAHVARYQRYISAATRRHAPAQSRGLGSSCAQRQRCGAARCGAEWTP